MLNFHFEMQKYAINIKSKNISRKKLLIRKYFLDFSISFCEFILAELD